MPLDCGQTFQSLCFRADLGGVASVSFTNLCVLSGNKLEYWSFFLGTHQVTDHALITWLSCTDHETDHALITSISCTDHMTAHALITWMIIH